MLRASRSAVIDAEIEKVWAILRDFNGLASWHPLVADSHIENGLPPDSVGCIRNFNLKDGSNLREQLLALSDVDHYLTYSILESLLPVRNYVATTRLLRVTDTNKTFAQWTGEFDCPAGREQEVTEMVGNDIFAAGLKALNEAAKRR